MRPEALLHHLPNVVTTVRLLLVLPTGWAIVEGRWSLAFGLFVLAGVSDAVDGAVARGFGWTSRFGAIADPLADKVLTAVVFLALAAQAVLPGWLAALAVGRELVIVTGALCYHFRVSELQLAPTVLGKVNTVVSSVFAGTVLGVQAIPELAFLTALGAPALLLVTLLMLVSGGDYVWTWSRKATLSARSS